MSLHITLEELLAYSEEERSKWERWLKSKPREALRVPVQTEGRFPEVWHLLHHIFLVEMRHTQRLMNDFPVMEDAGVEEGDVDGLFEFARRAREQFRDVARSFGEVEARKARRFQMQSAEYTLTPRKLIFHVLMHEARHWAQIAVAVRNAGYEPPGNHDLLFSEALQ